MKFLSTFFGHFGGIAIAVGQTGVLGPKWSGIVTGVGAISLGLGVHAASKSGPDS
jgi:hypothetical protein